MDVQATQLYMAYLDPVFGRELGGYKPRPVLVVSSSPINRNTRLVIVVPGTSRGRGTFPNVVEVQPSATNGLETATNFECHQIRAIDQARLMGKSMGRLSREDLARVQTAMAYCLWSQSTE